MKLSKTMIACLAYVHEHGGKIHRHQGGFWAHANWKNDRTDLVWFGATTIEALVKRGQLAYDLWAQNNRGTGTFPVRAAIPVSQHPPTNEAP